MSEPTPADVRATLHELADSIRRSDRLDADAQRRLADLVDELSQTAATPGAESALEHLHASATELSQAIRSGQETSLIDSARDRLNQAVVAAETEAPVLSGIVERFVRALSDLGI